MRAKVQLGILVVIAIAFGVAISACLGSPPSDPPPSALDWDSGSWDAHNWK